MEDVWSVFRMTSLEPVMLTTMLKKQRLNFRTEIRLPHEVCLIAFLDSLDYRVILSTLSLSLCNVYNFLTYDLHSVLLYRRDHYAVHRTFALLHSKINSDSLMMNSMKSCLDHTGTSWNDHGSFLVHTQKTKTGCVQFLP